MKQFRREIVDLVEEVTEEFGDYDLDVRGEEHRSGPTDSHYLRAHRHEYVRTVHDIVEHYGNRTKVRVLEIGSFFGIVCICLARLGFEVVASDVPEYIELPEQKSRFAKHGIRTAPVRLEDYVLGFEDESFDVVVMCEVLEHLNFNPLPLLKEINRVLAKGEMFYLSLPNAARLKNRMALMRGQMFGVGPETFFEQLRPGSKLIANGHWREYTAPEVRHMLERLGFSIHRQYYFSESECMNERAARKRLGRFFYRCFPRLKENQTTIGIKEKRTDVVFSIPKTVHPTLREL